MGVTTRSKSFGTYVGNGVVLLRMFPRRRFLLGSLALTASKAFPHDLSPQPSYRKHSPHGSPAYSKIHRVATTRGNSALLILLDGTTLMVDAGAIYGTALHLT